MPKLVVNGAQLRCSMGLAPASLAVLPSGFEDDGQPIATVNDSRPMVNVMPFGMCRSMANPQVASATSAAQGVLTPQPCVPVTSSPWSPGSAQVSINDVAALTSNSTCNCQWAGVIDITNPGSDKDVT